MSKTKKVIVGITGATGAPIAYKLLQMLNDFEVEIHLIISEWAKVTINLETDRSLEDFHQLANVKHSHKDQAACISSGSFRADAMIIVPCSMKTLAAIKCGFADNLISRSADVMLKEKKTLILAVRETPLNPIHLENMLYLSKIGVQISPLMPAFYNNPQTIDDIITHNAARILDQIGLEHQDAKRWKSDQ